MASERYHLRYDATIDDAVDVSLRLASRTHAFRRQLRLSIMCAGMGGALAMFAAWMYIVGNSLVNIVFGTVAGVLFGIVFAAIFDRFFEKEIRKRQRKIVAEQFVGKPIMHSELELGPDAVWIRQGGMETTFPWTTCTGVRKNPGDIEINFASGMCVIPNRHFASSEERQAFFEAARGFHAGATSTTPAV